MTAVKEEFPPLKFVRFQSDLGDDLPVFNIVTVLL